VVTVEVPVATDEVITPMRKMRQWLDEMRFDASILTWRESADRFVVRVGFKVAEEAAAFAEQFAGRVL
jgi:hypothetical protein